MGGLVTKSKRETKKQLALILTYKTNDVSMSKKKLLVIICSCFSVPKIHCCKRRTPEESPLLRKLSSDGDAVVVAGDG